ncbi:hypothetical protein C8F04DRAFT_1155834 [Mycena alexandri]|uniref:Uncharacterized protein n=1 Tax=Mycena alexandri TaxID=1745969 RepID=A0AAD6WLZ0_9AGAR|nr:hypothetical protein C8F04DRAFT_1155834 [Mycena alexandri]
MSNDPVLSLSLTDNATLEYVLSDIPFFCVGLTALAVFFFMIVMRRIDMPAISLYSSSLIAFVAAIIDPRPDPGLALNTVTGLIDVREVGLALSFGFRYLYLWAFVAQRPRYEPRPRTQDDPLFSETHYHSANWERWGFPGVILKFALLGAVFSIPILQIYGGSIDHPNHRLCTAHCELMLNLFLSTVAPWWRPFTPYIVPIIALMISTGIGAGNLLLFKFSETTLGRFLQAVEIYALMLSLLVFTFYNVPKYDPGKPCGFATQPRSSFFGGLQDFKGKNRRSGCRCQPPHPWTFLRSFRLVPEALLPPHVNRASHEFPPGLTSGRHRAQTVESRSCGIREMRSWVFRRRCERGRRSLVLPRRLRACRCSRRSGLLLALNAIEPQELIPPTPNTLEVPSTPSTMRPFTGVSFASYYGMASSSRLTMPSVTPGEEPRNTESPIYGLNGILTSAPAVPESPTISRRPPSQSTLSQTELDKSIAALRLFSPTTTVTMPVPPEPEPDSEFKLSDRTQSMSSGTNRSEFSLSIFPDPPPVEPLPETILPSGGRARDPPFPGGRRRQSRIPRSAVSNMDNPDQVRESEGTQYDVTSFIGDLMTPGPASEQKISVLGEVESYAESGSAAITTAASTITLRPLYLSSMSPSITSLPPATASSGALTSSSQTNYEYPVLKPLLLGGAVPAVPSPLSAGARRTAGTSALSGPAMISGPRPQEDEQAEEAEAFEKPRRPPALTLVSSLQDSQ